MNINSITAKSAILFIPVRIIVLFFVLPVFFVTVAIIIPLDFIRVLFTGYEILIRFVKIIFDTLFALLLTNSIMKFCTNMNFCSTFTDKAPEIQNGK